MDFVFRMCRFIGRLRSFVRCVYINKVYVNGKRYTKSYLTWDDVKNGMDIEFVMSKKPNRKWAVAKDDIAPSVSVEGKTVAYKHGMRL